MEFRLHGLVPVAKASGPDTARSAAGRLAAETVVWLPQATSPQAGARWAPVDDHRAIVTLDAADETVDVRVTVDDDGRLRQLHLQRRTDSADPPAFQGFGGDVSDEHETAGRVRVARSGTVGWGGPTAAATDGAFFRYMITSVEPVPHAAS
jgi:hypothetical protein